MKSIPDLSLSRVPTHRATLQDEDFFERVSVNFDVSKTPEGSRVEPTRTREVAMCLRGDWYMLTAKDGTFPADDPVKSLDVQVCLLVCTPRRWGRRG